VRLQQSRRVLGPFDVPANPEHRLRDAAQHRQLLGFACCC
jgi:hypothetical protein